MESSRKSEKSRRRCRWWIRGQVQGVGFRPFVYRLTQRYGLTGFIRNDSDGVTLEIEGLVGDVKAFGQVLEGELDGELPPLAMIQHAKCDVIEVVEGEVDFRIEHSYEGDSARAEITIDTAVCDDCLRELFNEDDRRFGYGLINCTNCGPRYTIVQRVPYDRPNTTMSGFAMCEKCSMEYVDSGDRRFHAQPIACHECGPRVELVDCRGENLRGDPIAGTVERLNRGEVVAIKGLGGFHLAVRADEVAAVARLRGMKKRDAKPFAVMVGDIEAARELVELGKAAEEVMLSPRCPIVLARRRAGGVIANGVAPKNHRLGVMLPHTPIHHLLFGCESPRLARAGVLVMTSGNQTDEPLVIDNDEAVERLGDMCDAILWHDRPIKRSVDDSVLIDFGGSTPLLPIRRARGYVPTPIMLPRAEGETVRDGLCVGGGLKNTVAVVRDGQAIMSQHMGDLTHALSYKYFQKTVCDLVDLFGIDVKWVAHDLHPMYLCTTYAYELAEKLGVAAIGVQHHHAHSAAVMAEHGISEKVLAVVCDGVGYGSDGTIWGGELLLADLVGFERLARLRPMLLPGGDAAAMDTRRCALSLLHMAFGDDFADHAIVERLVPNDDERLMLTAMIQREINCPLTSSMGRVFDGVAALMDVCRYNEFEAQAGIALEACASSRVESASRRNVEGLFEIRDDEMIDGLDEVDLSPLIRRILELVEGGSDVSEIAKLFHIELASAWCETVRRASERMGVKRVALSGGVFCNQLLTELLTDLLKNEGFEVLRHKYVPPNDGGISLGQAAIAVAKIEAGMINVR